MSNINVVFVLGRPGAGKGTMCSKICEEFEHHDISAGALLRKYMDRPDYERHAILKKCMMEGRIVPSEITCELLEKEMIQQADSWPDKRNKKFLIDGFPLNQSNRCEFDRILAKKFNLVSVIYLNCSEDVCTERILARSRSSGRYDDVSSKIPSRLAMYMKEAIPVIEYYKSFQNFHEVDAEQELEKVYEDMRQLFL